MVFLMPGTRVLPGHLKRQKVPVTSDEGPDVLLGFFHWMLSDGDERENVFAFLYP